MLIDGGARSKILSNPCAPTLFAKATVSLCLASLHHARANPATKATVVTNKRTGSRV
jgi:hypothetical protein